MTAPKLTKAEKKEKKSRIQLLGEGASHCILYKKTEKAVTLQKFKKKSIKEKGERKLWQLYTAEKMKRAAIKG